MAFWALKKPDGSRRITVDYHKLNEIVALIIALVPGFKAKQNLRAWEVGQTRPVLPTVVAQESVCCTPVALRRTLLVNQKRRKHLNPTVQLDLFSM